MPYKTILVHLNNERGAARLLEYAVAMGERFGAHVIGLYVFPAFRISPPVTMPYGNELAGRLKGELHDEEKRVRHVFETTMQARALVSEWRSVTTEKGPVADVVMAHARAADIVITSQADPDWGFSDIMDCPDRLAIECGRPVIVVPHAGRFTGLPSTVIVAWNGRREAVRAAFDALPLLAAAQSVEVLTIEEGVRHDRAWLPDTEIATALARHGVKARLTRLAQSEQTSSHDIQRRAREVKADLLVMGAYGHSRLTEFVFGGATRLMLREMTVPVLFSH